MTEPIFWEKDIERPKSEKLSVNFAVRSFKSFCIDRFRNLTEIQTIQHRPDGSGMANQVL